MPTYEYQCKDCEHRFEQMQKMSDEPLLVCPECGKESLQRLVNAAAFHLKGSGWYKTDYASNNKSSSSSATESNSSSDNKTSAPSDSSKEKSESKAETSTSKD